MLEKIEGGVTAAAGFEASSAAAGIKYQNRTDMALIYSKRPCTVAGTFTTNVVKAAPVIWDRELVQSGRAAHAVIVNSGVANACTGQQGLDYCRETAQAAARALHIPEDSVLVGSTGVIGMHLPMDRIVKGVKMLAKAKEASVEAGTAAAKAIMTTDTHKKEIAYAFDLPGERHPITLEREGLEAKDYRITVGGMSKGSGMIHPNMCTMLAYITTDIAIDQKLLQKAVSEIVTDTFNMISVDGDTSTNDTLLVLANGAAGNPVIDHEGPAYEAFKLVLGMICEHLAKEMAGDGEGATRLIESVVTGADTKENARILAKSVICSNLTKAAVFGKDANWGRILCALGYSGVSFDPEKVNLYFKSDNKKLLIFTAGSGADFSEEEATELLSGEKVTILAEMNMGTEKATAWGCDLTYDYVKINADYRS